MPTMPRVAPAISAPRNCIGPQPFQAPDLDETLGLGYPAGDREHQGDRKLRGGLGQDAGRIGDRDAAPGGRRDVDVVKTRGVVRDPYQVRRRLHDRIVDAIGQEADDPGDVGNALRDLARGHRPVMFVEDQVVAIAQDTRGRRRELFW